MMLVLKIAHSNVWPFSTILSNYISNWKCSNLYDQTEISYALFDKIDETRQDLRAVVTSGVLLSLLKHVGVNICMLLVYVFVLCCKTAFNPSYTLTIIPSPQIRFQAYQLCFVLLTRVYLQF